eukprot:GFUD01010653.1.p1 GENE.GFUD01010653.1~~GFUD01010653.1.p1  ORF type:complete len:626 (+),score=162.41 GFUD01010653.1:56-1933(+)
MNIKSLALLFFSVLTVISRHVVTSSKRSMKTIQKEHRMKRSISCSLGGQRGCKWTCRMRGYIYGECKEREEGQTDCKCRKPLSRKALMEYITAKLSKHYPDVHLVTDIIEDFLQNQNRVYNDKKWDGKWRPLPLLIGVLYKVQERKDRLMETTGRPLQGQSQDLVELLGYYWHVLMAAEENIRPGTSSVEQKEVKDVLDINRLKYEAALNLSSDQVPWVWNSELDRNKTEMSTYIPDHLITIDHKQKCVVLTILGTRIYPAPQPLDIIMDLVGTTEPFLGGEAHAGMVWGTRNLVSTALPKLVAELEKYPGYSLLIIGYSLGAGLGQLLTMELELGQANDLLPSGTEIITIGYGSPPVFTSNTTIPILENIFLVQNNDDGITGASLRNINDVFFKTSAIDKLNYKRRLLLKMLLSDVNPDEFEETIAENNITLSNFDLQTFEEDGIERIEFSEFINEDQKSNYEEIVADKDDDDDDEDGTFHVEEDIWEEVDKAVSSIPSSKEPYLHHVAETFLVIRRKDESSGVEVQNYQGLNETDKFSQKLTFNPSMFDDHMPGGYTYIFEGLGNLNTTLGAEPKHLEALVDRKDEKGFRKKIKKKWRVFKSNTKEFFKGQSERQSVKKESSL